MNRIACHLVLATLTVGRLFDAPSLSDPPVNEQSEIEQLLSLQKERHSVLTQAFKRAEESFRAGSITCPTILRIASDLLNSELEHINSTARRNGRDPITLGTNSSGKIKLWVDVCRIRVLGVVGDVILPHRPDEETGILSIRVETDTPAQKMKVAIGSVVVGGPFGETHEFDAASGFRLRLASGNYKLLLPQFDLKANRWDVEIEPKSDHADIYGDWSKGREDRRDQNSHKERSRRLE